MQLKGTDRSPSTLTKTAGARLHGPPDTRPTTTDRAGQRLSNVLQVQNNKRFTMPGKDRYTANSHGVLQRDPSEAMESAPVTVFPIQDAKC